MSLSPNEPPLSTDDITRIDATEQKTLDAIQDYMARLRGVAIAPNLFLSLPAYHNQLQNMIDAYASLHAVLTQELFIIRMDQMIICRDQLQDSEKSASSLQGLAGSGKNRRGAQSSRMSSAVDSSGLCGSPNRRCGYD